MREIYGVLTSNRQLVDVIRYKLAPTLLNVVPYSTVTNAHLWFSYKITDILKNTISFNKLMILIFNFELFRQCGIFGFNFHDCFITLLNRVISLVPEQKYNYLHFTITYNLINLSTLDYYFKYSYLPWTAVLNRVIYPVLYY